MISFRLHNWIALKNYGHFSGRCGNLFIVLGLSASRRLINPLEHFHYFVYIYIWRCQPVYYALQTLINWNDDLFCWINLNLWFRLFYFSMDHRWIFGFLPSFVFSFAMIFFYVVHVKDLDKARSFMLMIVVVNHCDANGICFNFRVDQMWNIHRTRNWVNQRYSVFKLWLNQIKFHTVLNNPLKWNFPRVQCTFSRKPVDIKE